MSYVEDDFILIQKEDVIEPIKPIPKTHKTKAVTHYIMILLRFLWRHPYLVYNGIPMIVLIIYLYPILFHYYKTAGVAYAVYTSTYHTYSKCKSFIYFCHTCHSYITGYND